MKFNVNNKVKIKLTERGLQILAAHWTEYKQFVHGGPFVPPETDENGYTTMLLWEVMAYFGSYICNGCALSFDTDIILFDGDLIA